MLWLTVPDATTSIPSGSWEYLAGTTDATTIKDSSDTPIGAGSLVGNTLYSLIKHNGQLHRIMIANTDSTNPTYQRAHVARREDDGSWTLLGGDQGLRYSSTGALDRQIHAITTFNGDLYALFDEPASSFRRLHLARWNEGASTWTVLTTTSSGLHATNTWTNGAPYLVVRGGEGCASFLEIDDTLHIVFEELRHGGTSGGSGGFDQAMVAVSYDGSTFSRVAEYGFSSARINRTDRPAILNNELYVYSRNPYTNTYIYKYDGTMISQVNLDTGPDLSLLSGDYVNGHAFFGAEGKLYSIWNTGLGSILQSYSKLRIRESTDGAQTFSTTAEIDFPSTSFHRCDGAYIHEGTLYLLAQETPGGVSSSSTSARFGNQPLELKLFRKDGSSWTELAGGTINTASDRNAYAFDGSFPYNALTFIDNAPHVSFIQESFFDSGGNGSVSDDKIYIAWTAP